MTKTDDVVTGLDTNWDASIIAKPTVIKKLISPGESWYADPGTITDDSVIVYPYLDRDAEILGVDGSGDYYTRIKWTFRIVIHTPGLEIAGDGYTGETRLDKLLDGAEDALATTSTGGVLYRVDRVEDTTQKGKQPKWMLRAIVEVTEPGSAYGISSGVPGSHTLDGSLHSDVGSITEAEGTIVKYNATAGNWDGLARGTNGQVLKSTATSIEWGAAGAGSQDTFKTITGITNNVVADQVDDTLTLASGNNKLTIVGTTATDTITWTVDETNIDHDNLTNFAANEHFTQAAITAVGIIASGTWQGTALADAYVDNNITLTNITQITNRSHTNLTDIGTNTHAQLDTHVALSNEHIDWTGAAAGTIHTDNYIEGGAGTDTTALHDNVANEITAITAKTTPVAADEFVIEDSAASYAKKAVTFGNLESTLSHDALADFVAGEHFLQSAITTVGTIGTGTWQGTAIADGYIASAATWNAKIANLLEDTTPQLGGELDLNEKGLALDPSLGTNLNYEGFILELTISGLTVGQCVYVNGNNTGALADADAVGTMPAVGVYVGANKVLTHGTIRQDSWTWTAGQRLYVGTDGNLTSTAPSGTGDYIQIMGIAVNADAALIMPSLTEVKHT